MLLTGALLGPRLGSGDGAVLAEGAAGLPSSAASTGARLPGRRRLPDVLSLRRRLVGGWRRAAGTEAVTMLLAMLLGSLVIYAGGVGWLAHFLGARPAIRRHAPLPAGRRLKALLAAACCRWVETDWNPA